MNVANPGTYNSPGDSCRQVVVVGGRRSSGLSVPPSLQLYIPMSLPVPLRPSPPHPAPGLVGVTTTPIGTATSSSSDENHFVFLNVFVFSRTRPYPFPPCLHLSFYLRLLSPCRPSLLYLSPLSFFSAITILSLFPLCSLFPLSLSLSRLLPPIHPSPLPPALKTLLKRNLKLLKLEQHIPPHPLATLFFSHTHTHTHGDISKGGFDEYKDKCC